MLERIAQFALVAATLVVSWLGMQLLHELGHLLGAVTSGGEVERVVLHPLTISRTDLGVNPHPLWVVWCGPILGCLFPLALWGVARAGRWSLAFLFRFGSGFCFVANGVYIGLGSFHHVGDCGDMLRLGSPTWTLWVFGIVTVPLGFWIWNGQGMSFGWGSDPREIDRRTVIVCVVAALLLVLNGFVVGGR